ncbi:eukaryotic mitochondrial regulator protein-domain-containing protein [Naematelia encephala]|uniref:Eukaryotic mitochondrial regulator protein-domain-containing protein n=1 Tax=Naematelia encephala TaxID=71784 RepID=A0A1Y2AYM6_9TREE|nr:eukaryotic mitochondrial regulator protein-domain-containing protein [Naematelia encephala]
MSAIAGPSRIPWNITRQSRLFSSSSRRRAQRPDHVESEEVVRAKLRDRGYHLGVTRYLNSLAEEFAHPLPGQKAKWLGGNHPYPLNPSFRPPPPLGNQTQDFIYQELCRGVKTTGALAAEFNVSKARVEAIRKLKEVEQEFIRQGLPLQRAFLEAMEPLLGNAASASIRNRYDQQLHVDIAARAEDPATIVELEEEHRFDAGIGDTGAFGDPALASKEGTQLPAFELRDEDLSAAVRRQQQAESQAAEEAAANGEKVEINQGEWTAEQQAFPNPGYVKEKLDFAKREERLRREEKVLPQTTFTPSSGRTWRFVDVSSEKQKQAGVVQRMEKKREKRREKKQQRKDMERLAKAAT